MLKKFLFWFNNLFRKDDDEYGPDYSEVRRIKPSRYNTEESNSNSKSNNLKSSNKKKHLSKKSESKNKSIEEYDEDNLPTKDFLLKQIKANIFFLEQLQELLLENENYFSYQKKVLSMLKNSHNSYKIISRLKDEAPYYHNTMVMIYRHTISITVILEVST